MFMADFDQFAELLPQVVQALKPYQEGFLHCAELPREGLGHAAVLAELEKLKALEQRRWQEGFVSGAVYHGGEEHNTFLSRVYALYSATNPLHPDIWPSITKFEAEIVSMTARMLGADQTTDPIVGVVSSGGTESILLAMKAYRDWARATKGIAEPEIIAPTTAHAAFDKAAHYFDMKLVKVPVGPDQCADVAAMAAAITPNTAVLVGSAPAYPHGLIDPIAELAKLAQRNAIGCHTDACLGGFLLPWAARLGYPVPPFDFRLPGVTSISADTHKYGYAAKGSSVILYRGADLRHYQYYTITDWPGGLYFTPTFAGSRPGALVAACWAAMVAMGESGYLDATRRILETAAWLKQELSAIPGLEIIGDPLFVIALRSHGFSIYQLLEALAQKGWSLNGLTQPPAIHLAVTLRHTQPGVKERFIADVRSAVEHVKQHPEASEGLGPLYGLGATVETGPMVRGALEMLLDVLYEA
jgi:sphinganine-1-phosphate aldolase